MIQINFIANGRPRSIITHYLAEWWQKSDQNQIWSLDE